MATASSDSVVLASAADARYGRWLINMVGSVQRKSPIFDRIIVFDLGLTPFQRRLLDGAVGVDVRTVPPFVPHWRAGRTWKPWIWTNVDAETIVWLDAGITVLRPLTDFIDQAAELGYFVVSTGVPTDLSTPTDYYALYDLPPDFGDRISVASGILAFRRSSLFFAQVIEPTFRDVVAGRSLGFSSGEVAKLNWGLDALETPVVRDCPLFRHEQTVLNLHLYSAIPDPRVREIDGDDDPELYKYGGCRSPHDHPQQVIWSHRRSGDFRFLPRVRYRPRRALVGIPWGTGAYLSGRARHYRWLVRPAVYAHIGGRLLRTGRLRAQH